MSITNATRLAGYVGAAITGDGFTGVIAAQNFIGNLTGTASSSSVSTNAYGLTGTPNINVGVVTAVQFNGNITGTASSSSVSTNAYGLTGTPNINVGVVTAVQFNGNITGTAATITGDVIVGGNVSIAGTLTYEDVTNIDSIGLITARSGIEASGIITARAGFALTYYGDGSGLTGISSWDTYDTWLFGGS